MATNDLLVEKQDLIQKQSEVLENTNQQLSKEKKKLELTLNQLKEVNATKDKLFSIIAHDLRGPFTSIIGFAELLKNNFQKYDSTKLGAMLGHIFVSSKQAHELLENLLIWAQAQQGNIEFQPENLDLKTLVVENTILLENQAANKHIQIIVAIEEKIPVFADNNMLNTIIRNLLNNAIKFTPQQGNIIISADLLPNYVEITVADTGVGMSKEIKDKLFRIDMHVTSKGTENEKGSGLGLNLCKEFVEKHGGKIWVESKINEGSTFHFTIPNNSKDSK